MRPSAWQPRPELALAILGQHSLRATSGSAQKKLRSPHAMRNHVLRLFVFYYFRFHPILLLLGFILLFHLSPFIILFVFVLFHMFSYFTSFTINSSVFTLHHKKSVPEPLNTLISSRLSIAYT